MYRVVIIKVHHFVHMWGETVHHTELRFRRDSVQNMQKWMVTEKKSHANKCHQGPSGAGCSFRVTKPRGLFKPVRFCSAQYSTVPGAEVTRCDYWIFPIYSWVVTWCRLLAPSVTPAFEACAQVMLAHMTGVLDRGKPFDHRSIQYCTVLYTADPLFE